MNAPTVRTLKDCAACETVGSCDAHITGGSWPHKKGTSPCAPVIDADTQQIEQLLAQGYEYQRTGNKHVFRGGILVAS